MTPFLEILYQLSHETGLKLYPDTHHACKLLVGKETYVQLEMDPTGEKLLIGTLITEIPLGKFRENVLKHALVANSADYPTYGYLCYIQKINALALYETFPAKKITGPMLMDYIPRFCAKALSWKQAINHGMPGPHHLSTKSPHPAPRFGIKP